LVPKRSFPLVWIVLDLALLAGSAAFVWGPGKQFPQATAIAVTLGLAGCVVGALVARWFLATAEPPVAAHRTDEHPSPNANPRIRVRLK
jgi:ABC-type Mn2+/Zn2+ transport system permease subunit